MSADEPIDLTAHGVAPGSVRLNGHDVGGLSDPGSQPMAAGGHADLEGVSWYPTYDRASVERYLGALDAERDRLRDEISAAERRTDAAQAALASRTAELEARLGAVVLAARVELDRIDQEQAAAIAAIRAEAEAEARTIRESAELEAEAVRDAAASLSRLTGGTAPSYVPNPAAAPPPPPAPAPAPAPAPPTWPASPGAPSAAPASSAPRPPGPWPLADPPAAPPALDLTFPEDWTDAG